MGFGLSVCKSAVIAIGYHCLLHTYCSDFSSTCETSFVPASAHMKMHLAPCGAIRLLQRTKHTCRSMIHLPGLGLPFSFTSVSSCSVAEVTPSFRREFIRQACALSLQSSKTRETEIHVLRPAAIARGHATALPVAAAATHHPGAAVHCLPRTRNFAAAGECYAGLERTP